jgi:hypothetical protein
MMKIYKNILFLFLYFIIFSFQIEESLLNGNNLIALTNNSKIYIFKNITGFIQEYNNNNNNTNNINFQWELLNISIFENITLLFLNFDSYMNEWIYVSENKHEKIYLYFLNKNFSKIISSYSFLHVIDVSNYRFYTMKSCGGLAIIYYTTSENLDWILLSLNQINNVTVTQIFDNIKQIKYNNNNLTSTSLQGLIFNPFNNNFYTSMNGIFLFN